MARPSKLTPERSARILDLLRAGNTRQTAAQASGIDPGTLSGYVSRFPDFATAVKEAESEAESRHVANIAGAAARGSWQASAWWLERRRYADWGRKDRVQFVADAREMARNAGVSEDDAVRQAEQILAELRSARRA